MSEGDRVRAPLRWEAIVRSDGVRVVQARARNNSWYLVVPAGDGYEARYASQSANALLKVEASDDAAKAAAEDHADRYDTRA
jgi:hypothetical protein